MSQYQGHFEVPQDPFYQKDTGSFFFYIITELYERSFTPAKDGGTKLKQERRESNSRRKDRGIHKKFGLSSKRDLWITRTQALTLYIVN